MLSAAVRVIRECAFFLQVRLSFPSNFHFFLKKNCVCQAANKNLPLKTPLTLIEDWLLILSFIGRFVGISPSWLYFLSLVTRTGAVSRALRKSGYFTPTDFPLSKERNWIGFILVGSSLSWCYLLGIQSFCLRLEVRLLSILRRSVSVFHRLKMSVDFDLYSFSEISLVSSTFFEEHPKLLLLFAP